MVCNHPSLTQRARMDQQRPDIDHPHFHSRRIVTAGVPWVAATNSHNSLESAFDGSVLLNRLNEVTTAGRMKTTVPPQPRAECQLINSNGKDHHQTWQVPDPSPKCYRPLIKLLRPRINRTKFRAGIRRPIVAAIMVVRLHSPAPRPPDTVRTPESDPAPGNQIAAPTD